MKRNSGLLVLIIAVGYNERCKGGAYMNTKDIQFALRTEKGMSQDELAGKVFVTRQAVSRWENGETVPNTETLKLLSQQ